MNRLFYIIVFVLVSSLCFVLGRATKKDIVTTQVKEVVIRDTLRFETPAYIYRNVIDTIYVPIEKTIRLRDTLYMNLPLEKKLYSSSEYYAEVSGYRPSLDYIEVYPKTKIVKEYVNQPSETRNALSFGIEPSYMNTLSIPIYLEYGRMLHENVEIYGQIAYDLPSKSFGVGAGLKIGFDF